MQTCWNNACALSTRKLVSQLHSMQRGASCRIVSCGVVEILLPCLHSADVDRRLAFHFSIFIFFSLLASIPVETQNAVMMDSLPVRRIRRGGNMRAYCRRSGSSMRMPNSRH